MCRFNGLRWLPAIGLLATLATGPRTFFAQVLEQTQAVIQPSTPVQAIPQIQPTPVELGDSLMMHQRYQAAIEAYKKGPTDSSDTWNKLGIAYQMMLNMEDASRCYQASLKINPRNAHVLNNLGTIYDSLKQYKKAERAYRKALKLDPQSALIYKNLGTNLLAQHKFNKGWEVYQKAMTIDPQVFESSNSPRVSKPASSQERGALNYYMAKSCARAGRNERAIEFLRMALNEGFTNPKKIIADNEFASLRGIPAFEQLLAAQGSNP
jgi:tetratricopeptide (TPR) repeat protein